MSLFSGLYTGSSGLVTNQNSLNTTAHNLANIGTAGYTRQQVTQANRHYDTIGQAYVAPQQVGLGVSYAEVRAIRDVFLDKRYRLENGRSQYYQTGYEAIREVETLFGEMQGTEFQTSLSELERTVQELQKNPSDATNQGLLVSKAYTFLERAQAVYNGLSEYQDNVNEKIKGMVEDINDYGKRIYEINEAVIKIEAAGIEHANDLRDQRDKLLDELAGFARISYKEDVHGAVTVQLEGVDFITSDFVYEIDLLSGKDYNTKFEEEIKNGEMTRMDDNFVIPSWKQLRDKPVISSKEEISSDLDTDIGALKALINARGARKATYKDLGLSWESGINYLSASGTPTDASITTYNITADNTGISINGTNYAYNAIQSTDGTATMDTLQPGNYSITHNGMTFMLTLGEESTVEDIASSLKEVKGTTYNNTGMPPIDFKGLDPVRKPEDGGSYLQDVYQVTERSSLMTVMAEFDNLVHGIITGMNRILEGGKDLEGNPVNLFKKITVPRDENGTLVPMPDGTDGWSLANVYIDPAVRRQPTLLHNGFIMESDNATVDQDAADALADLFLGDNAGKLNPSTRGSLRFSEYYVALVGENAIRGEIYRDVAANEDAAAKAIDAQRQQVVGVSDNEELTNMIRYQNAYNASSRYINTISAMLDNLFGMLR